MKKIFLWAAFFIASALVIGSAIKAGMHHDHCDECRLSLGKHEHNELADLKASTVKADWMR